MADSTTLLSILLTTVHSNVWTNTTSTTLRAATSTSAPLTDVITNSSVPFTFPPLTSASSLTSILATQTSTFIRSTVDNGRPEVGMSTEKNISSDVPEEKRRHYLAMLQEETTDKLMPTVVFLAVIAVVGLFGNSMVLLVYSKKGRRNATDIFIMAIAAFDLCTNVLAIPGEIYDTFHFWDFDSPALCKCRIYLNSFTTLTSALALLAVAFSRYKKVCRPFGKQTSLKTAKITTGLTAFIISICAVPNVILYGTQTRPTPRPDIFGTECSTDDAYVDTIWPLVYTGFLTLLFLIVCVPLIVFYILIGVQAWRHSKIHGIPMIHKAPTTSDHTMSDTLDSVEETEGKSNGWRFFKKKRKKYDITPGDSSGDENNDIEEKADLRQKNGDEKKSEDETDPYCTKMMRSPTKDKSHVNMPMLRELSVRLNKIRDSEMNTDEEKDEEEDADKVKAEAAGEMSPLLEGSNDLEKSNMSQGDAENCQNKNSIDEPMSDFAASMQWVDITYCLNEGTKAEEQGDVTDDGSSRKKSSQSARVSRQNSLRQKLADTLTRAKRAKKESIALKEMEKSSNTTATSANDANNHHISFQEIVTETNGDIKRMRELKTSCETSSRNSPRSGTLTPKSRKSKNNTHRRVLTRTTLMLIIISVVYVIAFVPHLVVMTCKFLVPNFLENMSDAGYITYNIFLRFFFINSAANAIIYSLCDVRFREQALKIIRCKK